MNGNSAQELNANQLAVISDFDSEGLSAAIQFTSEEVVEVVEGLSEDEVRAGSMTTYVVRGMVSDNAFVARMRVCVTTSFGEWDIAC